MVIAYYRFGRAELYDSAGALLGMAAVPFPSDPLFVEREGPERYEFIQRYSLYTGCAVSEERVYLLFSGAGPGTTNEEKSSGEWVHVFDWEGRLERIYHLDRPMSDLALSADRRTLYAASMMSAEISAFRLPPEGPGP